MCRLNYILLFALCFSFSGTAQNRYIIQPKNSPNIKNHQAKNFDTNRAVNQIAKSIIKNKSTDFEKSRAIYLWITNNIAYDYELRVNKKLQKQIYTSEQSVIKSALHRKKALCGGLSFLYKELCKSVGIEAKSIHGFTKMASNYKTPNHTWNAVKLNGKWYLLDITWSISIEHSNNPDMYWYLTNPSIFIKSHYPEDSRWSFISNPPKLSNFMSIP